MSRFRARPRPNGYDIDTKAPDGWLLAGYRKICKGGYVRFQGSRWRHPDMIGHEGKYVFVHVDDCWGCAASFAFDHEHHRKWGPPQHGIMSERGRRPMIGDDWTEDEKLEAEAEAWYSQAQLDEIERKKALTQASTKPAGGSHE